MADESCRNLAQRLPSLLAEFLVALLGNSSAGSFPEERHREELLDHRCEPSNSGLESQFVNHSTV